MDSILSSVSSQFGMMDTKFLAQCVAILDPKPPIMIGPDTTIEKAIANMKKLRIGCLLMADPSGKCIGIFSERDVLNRVCLTDLDITTTPVSKVMTADPHVEPMTTTIAFALHLMSQGGYRHLPLVDDKAKPVGIISIKDILDFIEGELVNQLVNTELA